MDTLPLGLPTKLELPGVGTLTGDAVVLTYIFVAVVIISVAYFALTSVHFRRGRRTKAQVADAVLTGGRRDRPEGVLMGSGPPRMMQDSSGRAMAQLTAAVPYHVTLEKIGAHLARKAARDICIGEIDGGFLLLYTGAGVPAVETMTTAQVVALRSTTKGSTQGSYQQLSQVGRYLDQQFALSILVAQQQAGYYVEYAAPPSGQYAASKMSRVSRLLDQDALLRLSRR